MDNLTTLIKTEIKRQYKSVRQFSQSVDIPQSTIISALRKGIGGTAFDSVVKMCDILNIKLAVNSTVYLDQEKRELLEAFSELDEKGKHSVESICKVELLRCRNIPIESLLPDTHKTVMVNDEIYPTMTPDSAVALVRSIKEKI